MNNNHTSKLITQFYQKTSISDNEWEYLINHADCLEKNFFGNTPLMVALQRKLDPVSKSLYNTKLSIPIWKLLIEKSDCKTFNKENNTPLMLAIKDNSKLPKEIWAFLIEKSDLHAEDSLTNSPLILAFENKIKLPEDIWKILIENSDCNKNVLGRTPLLYAIISRVNLQDNVWELLINKSDCNPKDAEIPLTHALFINSKLPIKIWKLLIEKTDCKIIDKKGHTPIAGALTTNIIFPDKLWNALLKKSDLKQIYPNTKKSLIMVALSCAVKLPTNLYDKLLNESPLITDNRTDSALSCSLETKTMAQHLTVKQHQKLYSTFHLLNQKQKEEVAFQIITLPSPDIIFNIFTPEQILEMLHYIPNETQQSLKDLAQEYIQKITQILNNFEIINNTTLKNKTTIIHKI
jgi:hypothetical protein